jgi:hypothetical protein
MTPNNINTRRNIENIVPQKHVFLGPGNLSEGARFAVRPHVLEKIRPGATATTTATCSTKRMCGKTLDQQEQHHLPETHTTDNEHKTRHPNAVTANTSFRAVNRL